MSATLRRNQLVTVDNPKIGRVAELSDADRDGPLAGRLHASKPVHGLVLSGRDYVRDLAAAVSDHHRPGTRTIVVVNTVDRASDLHRRIKKQSDEVPCVLVHSRFRPGDRERVVEAALADVDESGPGRIVVSTQVLEAGVDVSATTLVTELAPWASIVQRAGRCNRDGQDSEASLWWVRPRNAAPYEDVELSACAEALVDLEGRSAAPAVLEDVDVPANDPLYPVLHRRDLVELFDTLPDLSGNDVDVARFIRSTDDVDVHVAWRATVPNERDPLPGREERCPVPLAALRDPRAGVDRRRAWRFDHVAERWRECRSGDLRPGQVIVLDAGEGGYEPERGWSPTSTTPVPPVDAVGDSSALTEGDIAVGGDPISYTNRQWVSLRRHLGDVETAVRALADSLGHGLPATQVDAAVISGRYHDLGKAHQVFQDTLAGSAVNDRERSAAEAEPQPWAKSGGSARPHHQRPHFRHELVSALALLAPGSTVLDGVAERNLVVYLVAAHHGRVRLGFRSLPDEVAPPGEPDRLFALGVWDRDELPAVDAEAEVLPPCRLDVHHAAGAGPPTELRRGPSVLWRCGTAMTSARSGSGSWRRWSGWPTGT